METLTPLRIKRLLLLAKHGGVDHKRWHSEYCQLSHMGLTSWCLGTAFISEKGDKLLEELFGK